MSVKGYSMVHKDNRIKGEVLRQTNQTLMCLLEDDIVSYVVVRNIWLLNVIRRESQELVTLVISLDREIKERLS